MTQAVEPIETPRAPRRGLKLPPALVIPLIALLLAGGGWLVYRQIFATPKTDLSMFESPDSPAMNLRRQLNSTTNNPAAGIGILKRDNGADLQLHGARARFVLNKEVWTLDPSFNDPRSLGADRTVQFARFTAVNDKAAAAKAKVTPEQIEKLKKIVFPRMVISDADKARLLDLWGKYQKAGETDKTKIEAELMSAFRQIAGDAISPTQKAHDEATQAVREVLTPQQLDTLRTEQRRAAAGNRR